MWKQSFWWSRVGKDSLIFITFITAQSDRVSKTLRGIFYKPYESVFRRFQADPNIVTFEDFANMILAIPDDFRHNNHWIVQNLLCDVCNHNYDFILHVEDDDAIVDYVLRQVGLASLVLPNHDQFLMEKKDRIESNQDGKEWEPIPNLLENGQYHNKELIQVCFPISDD